MLDWLIQTYYKTSYTGWWRENTNPEPSQAQRSCYMHYTLKQRDSTKPVVKETLKLPWDTDAIREYVRMTAKDQQNEIDEKCIARSLNQNETTSAICEKRDIESQDN